MISLCSTCGTVVRVIGNAAEISRLVGEDSEFWPNGYVCPKCGGSAVGVSDAQATTEMLSGRRGDTLFELMLQDAFALYSGLGLPKERQCSVESVDNTLREGVQRWGLSSDPVNGRVYLNWLETAAGTRIYLGAGPYGAVVFRVRPKQSYVDMVQDGTQVGSSVQP
jgi:hypothetical protein